MKSRVTLTVLTLVILQSIGCGAWKRFNYEGFNRDGWQKPSDVIGQLGIAEGTRIADIGAGGGYFTVHLAKAVGDTGRVYAVDVDDDMVQYLEQRKLAENWTNVEVVRGEFADPKLPDGEIDLIFTSNTFHHISDVEDYFARLQTDLRPAGRVAILEHNDASFFPRTFGHMTAKADIIMALEGAGYVLQNDFDLVDRQSFLVFARADAPK